jgi:hypothetical protein
VQQRSLDRVHQWRVGIAEPPPVTRGRHAASIPQHWRL